MFVTGKLVLAAAMIAGSFVVVQPGTTSLRTVRTDLQRHDLSIAGREMLQSRIDFEPGVFAPMHTHPGEEIIYVLEGALEYQVGDGPKAILRPGDVLFVPPNTPHSARNVGSGRSAELGTFLVEKGKPLVTLVDGVRGPGAGQ